MSIKYYVIDTETNGIKSKYHEINEISVIRCDDRVQLTEFVRCEFPERSSFDALRITGKTLDDLSSGKNKEEVVENIINFLNLDTLTPAHRCVIGHNVNFDMRFIHALFESCNKAFPVNLWLDTIAMTKQFLDKTDTTTLKLTKTATGKISTTLQASCDMVGIKKFSAAHASKVDSRNTYLLWKKLMEMGIDHLPLIQTIEHQIEEREDVDELLKELGNE